MVNEYKYKRKDLTNKKREVMKQDFNSSKERKSANESFKREFRSLKRSEKNKVKKDTTATVQKFFGVH